MRSLPRRKNKNKLPKTAPRSVTFEIENKANAALSIQPLTIGLLQHEIDTLIETQSPNKSERKIEQSVMRELAKILPAGEITAKKEVHHHTDIVVKNITERGHHSPFVLDLTELVEKKKAQEEHKARIHSFFKRSSKNTHEQNTVLSVPTNKESSPDESPDEFPDSDELFRQLTTTPLFYHFNLPSNWHRSVISLLVVGLLIIAPIKVFGHYQEIKKSRNQIVNYASSAYEDMKIAGRKLTQNDSESATADFGLADSAFSAAEAELNKINPLIKAVLKVLPTDSANLADAEYLIEAGKNAAQIGEAVSDLFNDFKKNDIVKLTDRLAKIQAKLFSLTPKLNQLNANLEKIRPSAISSDKLADFSRLKNYLSTLTSDLKELNALSETIRLVLGSERKQRYLFIFQNNNEIRPTGGFMGSYALVDVDRGEIKNLEIPAGGTYDLQGSLLKKVISPEPLHLINPLWEMQDANWFPDFPTSAKKIKWFYENAGGPSVDGVIAINASLIPELMKITGGIYLVDGRSFQAANFVNELQKTIDHENKTVKDNKPKKILSEIGPELLKKIFTLKGEKLLALAQTLKNGLTEKDLQLYFSNEEIQTAFSAYGWTGEILDSSKDYLSVVNANVGGFKTDAFVDQKIKLETTVDTDGAILNTLTVQRRHNGNPNDEFSGKSNLVYSRIYTPLGSKLISAEGWSEVPPELFEQPNKTWEEDILLKDIQGQIKTDATSATKINTEFNKTVFAGWLQTDVGEESIITLKYKLPFSLSLPKNKGAFSLAKSNDNAFYSLFVQKQSGSQNIDFSAKINLPEGISPAWLYPAKSADAASPIEINSSLSNDQLFAFELN